jgi:hypothetical protein
MATGCSREQIADIWGGQAVRVLLTMGLVVSDTMYRFRDNWEE